MIAPQQAQRIVLLRRQVVSREQLIFQRPQPVVRSPQAEKRFLFEAIESPADFGGFGLHGTDFNHSDNSCPDNY